MRKARYLQFFSQPWRIPLKRLGVTTVACRIPPTVRHDGNHSERKACTRVCVTNLWLRPEPRCRNARTRGKIDRFCANKWINNRHSFSSNVISTVRFVCTIFHRAFRRSPLSPWNNTVMLRFSTQSPKEDFSGLFRGQTASRSSEPADSNMTACDLACGLLDRGMPQGR